MKFGIIGAGMIGHFHAKAITAMTGGELHSVFDLRAEAAEKIAEEYGGKAYSNIDDFLADPELEIVTIGTPSGAHLDPALAALNAGKHVICEKPLEITTERIDQLMAAAAKNGKTLSAVLNRRFHPGMDAFKKAADEGRFGKLTSASAYVKWYRDQAYYDSAGWRGTWALDGGGALMNQSVHTVDALLYLAGPAKSVQAVTACLAHERIEVEDSIVATVEFENGALGVIECSTCTWSKAGHPARVQLAGTDGSVFLADEAFEIWDFREEKPEDSVRTIRPRSISISISAISKKSCNRFKRVVSAKRMQVRHAKPWRSSARSTNPPKTAGRRFRFEALFLIKKYLDCLPKVRAFKRA
jgi:UDP-N-acetyl-2-amino-2-deoxyglucuronate dehydrogenase